MLETIRTMMTGAIDYAGLFPPSQLEMKRAVSDYAKYTRGEHAPFLGRFVCPAHKLGALTKEGAMVMPGTFATSGYREHADDLEPWRVSAVITGDMPEQLETIYEFNERHDREDNGRAMVDAVEMRVRTPADIDAALGVLPEMIGGAFEVPQDIVMDGDPRGLITALAGSGTLAKIRCGGVEEAMIPTSAQIARFVGACKRAGVAFKCTAGLHHPVRAEHALTYEDNAPRGMMHGFVNVFVAAAIADRGPEPDEALLTGVLDETDPGAFVFGDGSVSWRDHTITEDELGAMRDGLCTSFGSCSFDEPIDGLKALGLL